MNWYSIFYWLSVADNVKEVTGWMAIVLGIYFLFACISALGAFEESFPKWEKGSKRVFYIFSTFFFISLFSWALLPSKKDSLMIIAGGGGLTFLTQDSSAKKLPSEVTNYLVTEIKNLAKESEVNLGISDQKDKILDEVKNLSAKELIDKMKIDSNLTKVILSK